MHKSKGLGGQGGKNQKTIRWMFKCVGDFERECWCSGQECYNLRTDGAVARFVLKERDFRIHVRHVGLSKVWRQIAFLFNKHLSSGTLLASGFMTARTFLVKSPEDLVRINCSKRGPRCVESDFGSSIFLWMFLNMGPSGKRPGEERWRLRPPQVSGPGQTGARLLRVPCALRPALGFAAHAPRATR